MKNEDTPVPHAAGPRLFLDTADTGAWERLLPTGIFHGVTTNPLLLERAHLACEVAVLADLARRAAALGAREIHLQTWGDDAAALEQTGLRIAEATTGGPTVLVKVPATAAGFRATARLRAAGLAVTLTAVYNAGQVLAAAAAGAAYAAPYLGRLDDAGRDGRKVVLAMQAVLRSTGTDTRLLVASLRGPERVIELARLGLDTFTFGPEVADALLHDELTDAAAAAFAQSAQRR
ncbi:MAG: transaldolase [bacterium]|jgi:transaldolase|nr:transaldolase [bacterium]